MEKGDNIFRMANQELKEEDILLLSPLQLAYIGDAVYSLLIKTFLLEKELSLNKLHKKTIEYVKAEAQSETIHKLEDDLTEREKTIVKRGRNAKSGTVPKNADMADYRYATGFEALFGYLYLKGRDDRIYQLFDKITSLAGSEK